MAIILDLLVVFIVCVSVYKAYKRGLVEATVNLVGYIGSIFVSVALSNILAPILFNTSIKPGIIQGICDKLAQVVSSTDMEIAITQISNSVPSFLNSFLFSGEDVSSSIHDILTSDVTHTTMATEIAEKYIGPAVILLLQFLLFAVLLVLCRLVIHLVLKVFRGIRYIPIVGAINGLLGSLIGVAQAAVYIVLLAMATNAVIMITNNGLAYLNQDVIDSTKLFMAFYYFNPLTLF